MDRSRPGTGLMSGPAFGPGAGPRGSSASALCTGTAGGSPSASGERSCLCIDLKSFYASVECVERGLDPMITLLAVADPERSANTICLAITPAMKRLGIRNRCRVRDIPPEVDYITAPPRMQLYIDYAARIYGIYLRYIAPEDIHVYSIDEAFLDVTDYLTLYRRSPRDIGRMIMADILEELGIRATCGVGTNLYLAKIALDITAKHSPDFIGELTEQSYCDTLWNHRPLTDFWQIGRATERRLAGYGIHTMGQIAATDEDFLYRLFGIDAELLIDHARGREPTTIADIKGYRASSHSLSSGQVLLRDYSYEEARLVTREMMDLLCLDMVDKELQTASVTLFVRYSSSLGLEPARGSFRLADETNANTVLVPAVNELYTRIVLPGFAVRQISICCNNVRREDYHQYDLFTRPEDRERVHRIQKAAVSIQKRYGRNAIVKGMNLAEGGTTLERNLQIGGHRARGRKPPGTDACGKIAAYGTSGI